jgi:tellurite resistance protein TehA-like permease
VNGVRGAVVELYPGYFAAVMATGIVSVGLLAVGATALSTALWAVGGAILVVLALAYGLRAVLAWPNLARDLTDPARMFTFFTLTAGLNVLATRSLLGQRPAWALMLWALGTLAWFALMYYELAALVVREPTPDLAAVNGGWLVAVVGAQSVAAFAAAAVAAFAPEAAALVLTAFTFWAVGVLLYVVFITLIMARLFFRTVHAPDMQPPYWINMGATAITTLAGSRLVTVARPDAFLVTVRPFLEGLTVMIWAWGTWWIPFLIVIGVWKYALAREPFAYHPSQWSIVFPLGMYGTATLALSKLTGFSALAALGRGFVWLALGAWLALGLVWAQATLRCARARSRTALTSPP